MIVRWQWCQHEHLFSAWRPFWAPAADEEEEETVRSVGTWRDWYFQIILMYMSDIFQFLFKTRLVGTWGFWVFFKCITLSDCVGLTCSQWRNLGQFFYSAYSSSFSFQHLYHRCCNGYDDDDHNQSHYQSHYHHYIHRFSHRWAGVRFVRGWSTLGRGHFTIFTANMF